MSGKQVLSTLKQTFKLTEKLHAVQSSHIFLTHPPLMLTNYITMAYQW